MTDDPKNPLPADPAQLMKMFATNVGDAVSETMLYSYSTAELFAGGGDLKEWPAAAKKYTELMIGRSEISMKLMAALVGTHVKKT